MPLDEQDTSAWDNDTIAEAEELLLRASKYGAPGRYQLEAALQSAHVHRIQTGISNWAEIVKLYDVIFGLTCIAGRCCQSSTCSCGSRGAAGCAGRTRTSSLRIHASRNINPIGPSVRNCSQR